MTVFDLPALRQLHSIFRAVFRACLVRICVFPTLKIHFLSERLDLYSPCLMTCMLHRLDLAFTSHPKDAALL